MATGGKRDLDMKGETPEAKRQKTSDKIKILLLEGVSAAGIKMLEAQGFQVEAVKFGPKLGV